VSAVRCPSCGNEIPREAGQHAATPSAGVVECPHCGHHVMLDKVGAEPDDAGEPKGAAERAEAAPPGRTEGRETFAGEETVEGVMEELEDKEGGPR
jgi:DNA-directed RNA polymerase subunit RPC12/RpoP